MGWRAGRLQGRSATPFVRHRTRQLKRMVRATIGWCQTQNAGAGGDDRQADCGVEDAEWSGGLRRGFSPRRPILRVTTHSTPDWWSAYGPLTVCIRWGFARGDSHDASRSGAASNSRGRYKEQGSEGTIEDRVQAPPESPKRILPRLRHRPAPLPRRSRCPIQALSRRFARTDGARRAG